MNFRPCPNSFCGEPLSLSRSDGCLSLYCCSCGYEAKEKREYPRKVWTDAERRSKVGTVAKIQYRDKQYAKEPAMKIMSDTKGYVSRSRSKNR